MKTPASRFLLAALASVLTLGIPAFGQDKAAPPPPAESSPDAAAPAPAPSGSVAPEPVATPAPAAAAAAAPAQATPPVSATPATPASAPSSELRRLDETSNSPQPASENSEPGEAGPEHPSDSSAPAEPASPTHRHHGARRGDNARVSVGHDSTLEAGGQADAVVSIFGSSTSAGDVSDAVVSVFGSSTSSGHVGDAVVSVFGSTRVADGDVGDAAVAVLGNTYVNGAVHGDVVAVLGDVELGPKAEISGNIVCVGGTVHRDAGAVVHGQLNNVVIGAHFGGWDWLHSWVKNCLVWGRPLAFAPHLMWAWWLTIGFFVLYLLLALLFPRGVVRCAETLEQRPGFTILTAFLVALLTPAAAILLLITIVGTPALILFLVVAILFGKAVMLAWVGRRITGLFGRGREVHPVVAVLIGGVIVTLLYTVPFVGFVISKLISWLGLGAVVYTLIQSMKRNRPAPGARVIPGAVLSSGVAAAAAGTVPFSAAVPATSSGIPVAPAPVASSAADAGVVPPAESQTTAAGEPPVTVLPPVAPRSAISAASLPRAGFWIRIAASLLDLIVVALTYQLIPNALHPNFLVAYGLYCGVFWGLRATTLGGIVCGLKIVRLDERRVDWMTALVRALGGFLSLFAAGLGFIWVAFDDQKQSWHDKIAGTTIVIVPRGVSLV